VALFRFHVILVACAVLFCLGFAAREGFEHHRRGASAGAPYVALFFGGAGLALGGYLVWFIRKGLRP
jgi:hypothetical protein